MTIVQTINAAGEILSAIGGILLPILIVVGTICDRIDPEALEKEGNKQGAQLVRWGRRVGIAATAIVGLRAAGKMVGDRGSRPDAEA